MASEFDLENALLDEAGCAPQQNIYEMQRRAALAYEAQQKALFQPRRAPYVPRPAISAQEQYMRQLAREQAESDERHRQQILEIRRVQEEERIRLQNELARFMTIQSLPEPHGIQQSPVQPVIELPSTMPFSPDVESDDGPVPAFERTLKRVEGTVVDDE